VPNAYADHDQCAPIKSYGKTHLENVIPEVNTRETVAHWCAVDTRIGTLTCVLEENYCFDAEMYADELQLDEEIEFREDHRSVSAPLLRNSTDPSLTSPSQSWQMDIAILVFQSHRRGDQTRRGFSRGATEAKGRRDQPRAAHQHRNAQVEHQRLEGCPFRTSNRLYHQAHQRIPLPTHARVSNRSSHAFDPTPEHRSSHFYTKFLSYSDY